MKNKKILIIFVMVVVVIIGIGLITNPLIEKSPVTQEQKQIDFNKMYNQIQSTVKPCNDSLVAFSGDLNLLETGQMVGSDLVDFYQKAKLADSDCGSVLIATIDVPDSISSITASNGTKLSDIPQQVNTWAGLGQIMMQDSEKIIQNKDISAAADLKTNTPKTNAYAVSIDQTLSDTANQIGIKNFTPIDFITWQMQ